VWWCAQKRKKVAEKLEENPKKGLDTADIVRDGRLMS
jgi:hypothetical protein